MFILDLLGWWYSHGWSWAGRYLFVTRSENILHFFSIPELIKTLFAPFRQDSVNSQGAPINLKLQAFGSNIISRCFGFLLRTILIGVGIGLLVVNFLVAVVIFIIWPLIPASPLIAAGLFLTGVGNV